MPWPWQRKKKVPEPRTDSGRPIPQPAWDERGWVTYMMGDPVEFSSADNSGYVYAVQDKRYRPLDPGAVRVKDGATGTVTAIGDDKLAVMVPEDAREIDPTLHPMKQKGLATGPLIFSRADLVNLKLENERKWARKADVVWLNNLTRTAMAVRPESGPPTPWGYHITPMRNLPSIRESGLDPARGGQNMQNYRWNTGGKIFISGPTAISHWHHIVEQHDLHSNEPSRWSVPVVLRFPMAFLEEEPAWDEGVKHDSSGDDSWVTDSDIPPEYIDVWDGEQWIPLEDAGDDLRGLYDRVLDEFLVQEQEEEFAEVDPDDESTWIEKEWIDPDNDEEDRLHTIDSRSVDEEQLHRPEQWDPTIDDFEEPEWMQRRRQARHAHRDYHEVAQDDEAYAIIDETGIGDTYWSRSAAAIRMDPEALRRAEDWIRKMLSRVAYGVASEALEKREEFAADLERRKDLAETELDSARQDAADGDPVTIFMGLAEPGEPAVVRVVPADPESGEEWQVDWESRPSGEIKTLKYGSLQELNAWLVSMAETQFSRVQKIDPAQQAEKVTLGQATVRALEEQAEGKTATLPLFGRIDLGTINGVPVGEVPVTLEESMRVGGAYYAGGPGSQPRMLLEIGPAPWSLKKVEERIPALVEVFEHEAVHGFQHASRPADDSYRPGMAGPTFDGVTDTRSAPDDVAHASADIEFYPRIVSEVHSFLRSGDTSNEAARRWVENQTTFTALDGPKWQKAVKVFFQEIDKARSRAAQRNDDMIKWEKAGQTEEAPSAPVYDSYEDLVEALGREPEVLDVMDGTPGPEPGTIYYDDEDLGRTVLLTLYADIDPEELDNTEAVPVFDLYTYARDVAMAEAVTAPTLDGFVLMDDENARERILPLSPSLTAPEGGDEDDDIEWERQAQFNDTTDDEEVDDLDLVGDPMAQRLDQVQWEEGPAPVYEPAPPPPKKKDLPAYEEPFGTDPGADIEPPASDKQLPKLKPNSPQNIRAILDAASDHEIHYWASWYNQAHDASAEIAQKTGQDFERTVGVVAALSPNMKWAANLKAAEMLLQNPEYYRRAALNRVRGLAPINAAKADALKPVADERRAAEKAEAAKIGQEKAALLAELAQPGVKVTQKAIKDGKFGPEAKKRLADIIRRTEAAKKAAAEPFKAKEKEIRESFQPEIDAVNQANPFTGVPQYTKNVLKALDVIANGPNVYSGVDPKTYQRIPGKAPPEANITGPKVSEFYNSIRAPEESKKEIVLDGHAINIYRGDPDAPLTEMRSLSEPERRKILRAYKQVAKEYGLLPQEVQAITWSIWREMKKKQNRPAEPQKKQPKQPKQQESFNFEGQDLSWSEIPVIKGRPVEEDDEGDDLPEWLEDVRIHDRPEDAPPKEKGRMFIGTVWEEARAA